MEQELVKHKLARNDYPIDPLLKQRWSALAFDPDRPIELGKLQSLLEAARWAPSSRNEQPWSFIVATKAQADDYARLLDCLHEGNRLWAAQAPMLLLAVAKTYWDRGGAPNEYAAYDVGEAMADMTVEATALGLFSRQMAGFDADKARAAFGLPDGYMPLVAAAFGYRGNPNALPAYLREREQAERVRKPLSQFVFAGQWGEKSPLADEEKAER